MNNRLVSTGDLMRCITEEYNRKRTNDGLRLAWIEKAVNDAPTIDAVSVVRCKDCKYFSMTTLGMEYACWHGGIKVWGETGEHKNHTVCTRVESPEHFCGYGERRANNG